MQLDSHSMHWQQLLCRVTVCLTGPTLYPPSSSYYNITDEDCFRVVT